MLKSALRDRLHQASDQRAAHIEFVMGDFLTKELQQRNGPIDSIDFHCRGPESNCRWTGALTDKRARRPLWQAADSAPATVRYL